MISAAPAAAPAGAAAAAEAAAGTQEVGRPARARARRREARRFADYATVAVGLTAVPYLWVLWDLFTGTLSPLRSETYDGNFFDLQARAILSGHLWLPPGSIGIEAFVHGGRQYTYFGILPSLLRLPVLAATHALDGRLTAPCMLLAWVLTGLFAALLTWRVRVLARGEAPLRRGEAAFLAAVVGSVTGGSVLVFLAGTPWVFDEDFAWSVALSLASLFALVGLVEQPSRGRAAGALLAVLGASLVRAPTAYGCEIGALLLAAWFFMGRAGGDRRRWGFAALAAALVPLLVAGSVNTLKFGGPFSLPMADQLWTSMNAHRRAFLAANGGRAFSFGFLPSTLLAYLRPDGLHFSALFPFVTLPTRPPPAVAGAVLDQVYPTASITASSPLLFLLGCWGVLAVARRRPAGRLAATRLPLVGAAAGCSGALLWGYIAERYVADFLPFLTLAACVGAVDLWRRVDRRPIRARRRVLGATAALGLFGAGANLALALTPTPTAWTQTQVEHYVHVQERMSDLTGHPLAAAVVRGAHLPSSAPAGEIYEVGDCQGLYLSSGWDYSNVPEEQYEHWAWLPVAQGPAVVQDYLVLFEPALASWPSLFPIVTVGRSTVYGALAATPVGRAIDFGEADQSHPGALSNPLLVHLGRVYRLRIVADPSLDQLSISIDGKTYLSGPYTPGGGLSFGTVTTGSGAPLMVTSPQPPVTAGAALCEQVVRS